MAVAHTKLIVFGGPQTRGPLILGPEVDSITIGRAPENDLSLEGDRVSRAHCRIFRQGPQWYVEDLGSGNGTRLRDQFISGPTEINDVDVLEVGEYKLQFLIEPDVAEERPSPPAGKKRPASKPLTLLPEAEPVSAAPRCACGRATVPAGAGFLCAACGREYDGLGNEIVVVAWAQPAIDALKRVKDYLGGYSVAARVISAAVVLAITLTIVAAAGFYGLRRQAPTSDSQEQSIQAAQAPQAPQAGNISNAGGKTPAQEHPSKPPEPPVKPPPVEPPGAPLPQQAGDMLDLLVETAILQDIIGASGTTRPAEVSLAANRVLKVKIGDATHDFTVLAPWRAGLSWSATFPELSGGLVGLMLCSPKEFAMGTRTYPDGAVFIRSAKGWKAAEARTTATETGR